MYDSDQHRGISQQRHCPSLVANEPKNVENCEGRKLGGFRGCQKSHSVTQLLQTHTSDSSGTPPNSVLPPEAHIHLMVQGVRMVGCMRDGCWSGRRLLARWQASPSEAPAAHLAKPCLHVCAPLHLLSYNFDQERGAWGCLRPCGMTTPWSKERAGRVADDASPALPK